MVKMKEIAILGRPIQLQERSKAQMKGVTIGEMLSYKFYDGEFHGMPLLLQQTTLLRYSSFLPYSCCQLVLPMNGRD